MKHLHRFCKSSNKTINILSCIVYAETDSNDRDLPQLLNQRLCTHVTGADCNPLLVKEGCKVVRVNAGQRERNKTYALVVIPGLTRDPRRWSVYSYHGDLQHLLRRIRDKCLLVLHYFFH